MEDGRMDIPDLLNGVNGAELLEPNEKDREYIRKYKEIQLGIDPDEPAFVITPRQLFTIEKMLPEFTDKVAKELGVWMFNDRDMFCRHLTSGARKNVYVGDIVPQKNIPLDFNNGIVPFLIECKNGYKANIPNLNNQTLIRQWLTKALLEKNYNQNIIK